MRFVGLALHVPVPDTKTIWLYREHLKSFGSKSWWKASGGGPIVDATVVEARSRA